MVERGVYIILNKVTGTRYIGGTTQAFNRRKGQHWGTLCSGRHRNARLQSDWDLYGPDAFEFVPVELVPDVADVRMREQAWLDLFWGDGLYNVASDAASPGKGRPLSDETRRKLRESHLGLTASAETRQKISLARRGCGTSDETRRKLRESHLGQTHSAETRQKISAAKMGRRASNETRQRMSEAQRGRTCSDETRQKLSEAHRGRVASDETLQKQRERTQSAETRRKIADANRGRTVSTETRQKLRDAWARRKQRALDEQQELAQAA